MKSHYDIIIAGGGMVGLSLALSLQASAKQAGRLWSILVVESFPVRENSQPLTHQPSFDARSTALAYGSSGIYQQLGCWQDLQQHAEAITSIHVSEQGKLFHSLMQAEREKLPALGYVVENAWLGKVLLKHALQAEGVEFCSPATVQEVALLEAATKITVQHKQSEHQQDLELDCDLLIVADGAQSGLREKLGISVSKKPYFQHALIANVCFSEPHQGRAWERFTEQGPMALLPLTDVEGEHRAALVWTRKEQQAEQLQQCSTQEFLQQLQECFGYRLGRFTRVGDRVCYPLTSVFANEQVRRGVAVMGNAAHFLHPVAGQGFNLSLRDCAVFADTLKNFENPGSLEALQAYQQQRETDQLLTHSFSDQLIEIFSGKRLPAPLREAGLIGLDLLPGLKSGLVLQAAGLADQTSFREVRS